MEGCQSDSEMTIRFFQRNFDESNSLSSAELREIGHQLQEAICLIRSDCSSETAGGGLYVGLGGVAAAFFSLYMSGIGGGTGECWLREAQVLVHRCMQRDLIPSSKVGAVHHHVCISYVGWFALENP